MEYRFCAESVHDGERIDHFLCEQFEDRSRSFLQHLIEEHQVLINDLPCKSNKKISAGDQITVKLEKAAEPEIVAEDIPLTILYEDPDVIVVDKPKGMVVHPAPGHYSGTLVNALLYHCKDLSGINGILRPGIVHRIDRYTTGSVIACKNDLAHNGIAKQLKEHTINRHYLCLVHGEFDADEGTVDAPIGRSEKDRKKMAINRKNGKVAITHYSVVKRFHGFTLLDCKLETGRTHQIRVHMASIHHPVVGDPVYCSLKPPCKLEGQALHAYLLGFTHPRTGEYIEIRSELPAYFTELLSRLKPF